MDISNFLARKLTRRFHTFDDDGDGQIGRSDFETSANRLAEEFGHSADSPARKRLVGLSVGLFELLASVADTDRSGGISEAEYKQAFADGLLVTEASFEAGYRPFLEAIMDVVDPDHDGRLTVDQHIRWTGALMRLPEADAREVHRRIDTDGDGHITTDDLLAAIHDFYFDEDPEGPGSWVLGKLDA